MGESAKSHYRLGMAYYNSNEYKKALEEFKLVSRESREDFIDSQYKIADIFFRAQDVTAALKYFDYITSEFPDEYEAYIIKGYIYYNRDLHWLAMKEFEKAIEILDQKATEFVAAKVNEPIHNIKVLNYDASLSEVSRKLASLYIENKIYEKAVKELLRCKVFYPEDPDIYSLLGLSYASLGDYAKAIDVLKEARNLFPYMATFDYNVACSYARMGNSKEALFWLESACKKDSKYKKRAAEDEDFSSIRKNIKFKKLIEQ